MISRLSKERVPVPYRSSLLKAGSAAYRRLQGACAGDLISPEASKFPTATGEGNDRSLRL